MKLASLASFSPRERGGPQLAILDEASSALDLDQSIP